jgi:4-nitrophenyl phosphatase
MGRMMNFSDIKGVIMDMDGVLWSDDTPLPGLLAFFTLLRVRQLNFVMATNNATHTPDDYIAKLERFGVKGVTSAQIITSGTALAGYLKNHYPRGTKVHILGADALRRVLAEAGFSVADEAAQVVVGGLDRQLTYDKLRRASLLIQHGAEFIATNDDASLPTPDGLVPGAGSIVAALSVASGREPGLIIGKPHSPLFENALKILNTRPSQTLMIGDRLETDILGAFKLGIRTALVLTGASTLDDVAASPFKPDGIYAGLEEVCDAWRVDEQ